MMFRRNTNNREVPGLNTASLPDLIFTVLFFFMIVTNMRHDEVKVRLVEPDGTELVKLMSKSTATYIYIGKALDPKAGNDYQVQVDNTVMPTVLVGAYMKKKNAIPCMTKYLK